MSQYLWANTVGPPLLRSACLYCLRSWEANRVLAMGTESPSHSPLMMWDTTYDQGPKKTCNRINNITITADTRLQYIQRSVCSEITSPSLCYTTHNFLTSSYIASHLTLVHLLSSNSTWEHTLRELALHFKLFEFYLIMQPCWDDLPWWCPWSP